MRMTSIPARVAVAGLLVGLTASASAVADAPRERGPVGPYLNGALPANPPAPSGDWATVKAFPKLTFEDPVGLTAGPGGNGNTLYVWGRQGVVWSFENDPSAASKAVFLDIRARCQGWDDGGLLGLAFHPRFGKPGAAERGYVYVWYTYSDSPTPGPGRPPNGRPTYDRLARFTVPDGAAAADPNSELVLIDQLDENTYHNGGGMFFHPVDGFLYLSLGDEGTGDNAQRIDRDLFSGVIRIDVDCKGGGVSHPPKRQPETGKTGHYFIPNDNPWVGVEGALEEFWCVGLRSPHRMTHDAASGRVWAGDVGEGSREEVDLIERGGNYQWRFREGTLKTSEKPADLLGVEKPPVYEYGHDQGRAVIGGYVYRGSEHAAALGGKYVFGDNNGRVWALTYDQNRGPVRVEPLCEVPYAPSRAYGEGLSSFGVDRAGEIYLCQLGAEGQIYRLARKGVERAGAGFPRLLSETGAFRDLKALTPAPGLVGYEVNAPLWSDGAAKRRWVAVPSDGPPYGPGERIGFAASGAWAFPDGTVFVKHFEIAVDPARPDKNRRLETRFLVRSAGGGVHGATYRWRDDQADAELVGEEGRDESIEAAATGQGQGGKTRQTWHYPARRECLSCHTAAAGYVLGVNARQLNRGEGRDNQVGAWARLGLLDPAPADRDLAALPRLVAADDPKATPGERVRSYLDANCAHCHRPGGVRASFDARYEAGAEESARGLIDGPVANSLGLADARVIAPGAPGRSVAYQRMTSLKPAERMPPLATGVVDARAAAALKAWIEGLPASPLVRLAGPSDRAVLKAGAEVTVEARVVPGAGAVRGVEFFRGNVRLGSASAPPYRTVWKADAAGSYALTARVRDDRGASATSSVVTVTVAEPEGDEGREPDRVYLSDLPWSEATSGWGPVEKDRSNGEQGERDGGPIRLNGRRHDRGLGVHAGSTLRYRLGRKYAAFLAEVGVDDEVGDGGSVVFQVWADGSKVFDSGRVTGRTASRPVRVDVAGREELVLVVTNGGDGDSGDHADWAEARLIPAGSGGGGGGKK